MAFEIKAEVEGVITNLYIKPGMEVLAGMEVAVITTTKTEHKIKATESGKVVSVSKRQGDQVSEGEVFATAD